MLALKNIALKKFGRKVENVNLIISNNF